MIFRFTKKAQKDFLNLDKITQEKIKNKILQYLESPTEVDFKLLKGYKNIGRIRQGDYRIVCKLIIEEKDYLEILRIQHRKDVYKSL